MRYPIIDSHVHSSYSEDCKCDVKDICNTAIQNEIKVLTLTDHVDFNPIDPGFRYFKLEKYLNEVAKLKKKHKDKIKLLTGVEFSEPHQYQDKLKEYNDNDLDLIIGAIHWIGDYFVGDEKLLDKYSKDEIFLRYYNLVYETVKNGQIDVLAHLDFPKRYLNYDYKNFHLIPQILRMMIDRNIVLEINTSTLRKGFDEPMPSKWILSKYKKMGGKKVTVGSDAHRLNELNTNFNKAYSLIEEFNFTLGYFENRNFIKVDKI